MPEGIDIIGGFNLKKKRPVDLRSVVANSTDRLALTWLFKGLRVTDTDTQKTFLYIGDETSNLAGDWIVIRATHVGNGAPANSLGYVDDLYIAEDTKIYYRKTGVSTWTAVFTLSGAAIYTVTGTPSGGDGLNGDVAFNEIGNVYKKESGVWQLKFNIAGSDGADGDSDQYATSSATSIDLATATAPLTLTIGTDLDYTSGQIVIISSLADNANRITAMVVSYNDATGVLIVNDLDIEGTGTHTDWEVNLTGIPGADGPQGKGFIHTEHDITLTQAKITAVEGGSYTPINPWSASIISDARTAGELVATPNIQGVMTGNSIVYDGTNWTNNGQWRGSVGGKGDKGDKGDTGNTGASGAIAVENHRLATGDNGNTSSLSSAVVPKIMNFKLIPGNSSRLFLHPPGAGGSGSIITVGLGLNSYLVIDLEGGTNLEIYGQLINTEYGFSGNVISGLTLVAHNSENRYEVVGIVKNNIDINRISFSQPGEVNFNAYTSTSNRIDQFGYVDMTYSKFVRPRVFVNFQARRDSGGQELVNITLQRSTDVLGFTSAVNIKSMYYRLDGDSWTSITMDLIDVDAPKDECAYRIVVLAIIGSFFYMSDQIDHVIHLVPHYIE